VNINLHYIVVYYKGAELVKQFYFNNDLEKAKSFVTENKIAEAVKGIRIGISVSHIDENCPYEIME